MLYLKSTRHYIIRQIAFHTGRLYVPKVCFHIGDSRQSRNLHCFKKKDNTEDLMNDNYAGRHLIIDGVFKHDNSTINKMSDRAYLAQYLEDVTAITGMTLVFPPIAMSFPFAGETNRLIEKLDKEGMCNNSEIFREFKKHIHQRNTEGGGVSAVAVWVESHCTLHSWTEKDYISIDLFSCSSYEVEPVIEHTLKALNLVKASFVIVDRMTDGSLPEIKQYTLDDMLIKS